YEIAIVSPAALDELAKVSRSGSHKAIVLHGETRDVVDGADLQRLILESEIPVVAALSGDAKGSAWLVAQCCDAVVYNREGLYSAANAGPQEAALFMHRFGHDAAGELLLTGSEARGGDLQQRIAASIIAEPNEVLATAVSVAEAWARLPRPALASWK